MEVTSSSCGSINEEMMANISGHGSTSATSQTGPLPSIESLLEAFRAHDENPPQSTNKQTTWYQFRIGNERNSNSRKCTLYPSYHSKPVFTLDSTRSGLSEVEGESRSDVEDGRKIYLFNNHINFSKQNFTFPLEIPKSDIDEVEDNSNELLPAEDGYSSQNENGNSLKVTHLTEGGEIDDGEFKATVSNKETTDSENPEMILEPNRTREESIRELFNRLGELLPCGDVPNLSRYKILDSSVQCIQSLLWRRQGMKRESLENVPENLNERKIEEAKDSYCETTLGEIKSRCLKITQVKDKSKPKQVNRKYKNKSKPKAKSKKVSAVGDETKVNSSSKSKKAAIRNVGITFVNEKNSVSQFSDSNKKYLALFFAENKQKNGFKSSKKAKETTERQPGASKTRSRNGKLNEKEIKKLETKAFLMYAKVWRPRLKKEMPVCTRVQVTNLLKCRWQGLSRKTKLRYQKKWKEQSQETTLAIEKSKKCEEQEGTRQSKKKQTSGAGKPALPEKRKKEQNKIENSREENNERPLKKTKKEKTVKDKTVKVNIVNWVQCDKCKKWRIIPENVGINTLPNHWYCGLNKDKKHNKCSIPEVHYAAMQV